MSDDDQQFDEFAAADRFVDDLIFKHGATVYDTTVTNRTDTAGAIEIETTFLLPINYGLDDATDESETTTDTE